jgi:hypothetical protein
MKRILLAIVVLVVLFRGFSFAADTVIGSAPAHVTGITLMGELWQNENRGGFFFYTDNLPQGVDYFIVRGGSERF